jgi:hypothetical protein
MIAIGTEVGRIIGSFTEGLIGGYTGKEARPVVEEIARQLDDKNKKE